MPVDTVYKPPISELTLKNILQEARRDLQYLESERALGVDWGGDTTPEQRRRASRLAIKAAEKKVPINYLKARDLIRELDKYTGQSRFPSAEIYGRTPGIPRGPTTLLQGSKPILRGMARAILKAGKGAGVAFPISGPGTTRKKIGKKRGATGSW